METKTNKRLEDLKFWESEIKPVSSFGLASIIGGIYLLCVTPMSHNESLFYVLMGTSLLIGYIIGRYLSNDIKQQIKEIEEKENV